MSYPIAVIDAFSDKPFAGNPAAVCLIESEESDSWMQSVAREMNLSETAFLKETPDGWSLRWFTPVAEVDLCGHATLASAHWLWNEGKAIKSVDITFITRSGKLVARRRDGSIELDFPADSVEPAEVPNGLLEGLGIQSTLVGRTSFDYFVELEHEEAVRTVKPDFAKLTTIETRGVIVTARSHADGFDFISRCFAPRVGIPEDPVTGSAHCALATYWGKRTNKKVMTGYQASERGGVVEVEWADDRVLIRGMATMVWRGQLL